MRIVDIKIGDRARRDLGDIDALKQSIERVGLLHPVVVNLNNELVSGFRRIEAYKLLGRDEIPHRVVENLDDVTLALQAEVDENVQRKDLSPLEAAEMAKRLEVVELEAARKRLYEGRKRGGRARHDASLRKNLPVADQRAADQIASAVGYSRPTLEKAKAVAQAAQDDPEHYGKLAEEMNTTGKVDPAYRKLKKARASDAGANPHEDDKIRSWNTGFKSVQRFIDRIEKEGGPASIINVTFIGERQGCASKLLRLARVFRSWAELLKSQQPEAMSMPAGGPATIEPGEGVTSPADEPAAPMSQQDCAEHIETEGPPVVAAQDGGDPDQPEATLPGDGPATIEPGEGATLPVDGPASPVSQQDSADHIETGGKVVATSEDSSRRDAWKRHDKEFFAKYRKRVGEKPEDAAEASAREVSVG